VPKAEAETTGRRHGRSGERRLVQIVVVGSTCGGGKVEDEANFVMLRDGQKGIDSKIGKWRGKEGSGHKTFCNPGSNGVCYLGSIKVGGRSVGSEKAGKGMGPSGLCSMADGVESLLTESPLLKRP
jgi:hypothetical protein